MVEHENNNHKDLSDGKVIALSIVVGAILISSAIIYKGKPLESSSASAQKTVVTAPSGEPTAASGSVEIKARTGQPATGGKTAKVTVVEFADFQCPFCQRFFTDTYSQVKKEYVDTGKIQYVFRHFPLSFHNNAEISGIAAECANRQGKFWEYHDLLFVNGKGDGTGLAAADLKKYADQLGLNSQNFSQCVQDPAVKQIVQDDLSEGTRAGVSGTPTFFVNGKKLVGAQPFSAFKAAIDEALK